MKYALIILFVFAGIASYGQSYTTINNPMRYVRLRADTFNLSPGDTVVGRDRTAGQLKYKTSDSTVYVWNGWKWNKLGSGTGGGGGTTYSAGYGLILNSTTFRIDSVALATRLRMYKVGDSLNALNTLGTVVNRGNTATRINIIDTRADSVPLAVFGSSSQSWQLTVSSSGTQIFGVGPSGVVASPIIVGLGGVEASELRNFGNQGSNLTNRFNIQGAGNTDTTGYWNVYDHQNGIEMIRAEEGKVYLPQIAPPLADKMLIIKATTGAIDTAAIGSGTGSGDYVNRTGTNTVTANNTWSGSNAVTGTLTVPPNSVGAANTQAATTALVKYSIDSTVLQIRLTSVSGSYIIPNSIATHVYLFVDPASVTASMELYLPAAGRVNQNVKVIFGENSRIANGNPVVTEFNVYNSDGSTITTLGAYPALVVSGDDVSFIRNAFMNKWHEVK